MPLNPPLDRPLRMGLVGGAGGFIGRVHARAAQLDGRAILVAGALSSDPEKAKAAAADFAISPQQAYGSYQEMIERESQLPTGERLDFISIATPNHTHFDIAKACVEAGFHVLCDKPMTFDLPQALELARLVQQAGVVFAVTYNYTGYPLVRQARALIQAGTLGEVQAVRAWYLQGSLRRQRTAEQQRRAAWKADPARAGASGCFGDIGIHAYNLACFITGLAPVSVSCMLKSFERGALDDYGHAHFRYASGALGSLTASRISHGRENDLRIEIDGTQASLAWWQEEPDHLLVRRNGQAEEVRTRDPGASHAAAIARSSCRLPAGHPEGYLEAFANLYTAAFEDIIAPAGGTRSPANRLYPSIQEGVQGMEFIAQCVASSYDQGVWKPLGRF